MPDVRLGPIFPTSARPERCGLYPSKRRAIAPRLKVSEADSQRERSSGGIGCLERYPIVERSDRAYVGGFNSPATQPAATVFIGSLATAFVKL